MTRWFAGDVSSGGGAVLARVVRVWPLMLIVGVSATMAQDWQTVGNAGFSAAAASAFSLAFNNGEPYVAYRDMGNGSRATVMRYTGGSWQTVGNAGFSAGQARYCSLAFYDNEPYLAYQDGGNGFKATVMRYTGGSWQTVGNAGFSAGEARYLSLVFHNGEPHVAYTDWGNGGRGTVMRYTGGSWQNVGNAGFSPGTIEWTSLAFHNGEPYVACRDLDNGNGATVMRYTGGSWQTVGNAGFSAGGAYMTSLAFHNGEPYVAYQDEANGSGATVMRYTGGSWQTVGNAGFSPDIAEYTPLAFYDGEPYVAYKDWDDDRKATVMRYTDGSWQTVGAAGFSAGSVLGICLAMGNGAAYVAYRDEGNGGAATAMRYVLAVVPTVQASAVTAVDVGTSQATIGWTRGNGGGCAVFVKQASTGAATPANDATYAADTIFGDGSQIGTTGWYCVYAGTGTSVTVTGLSQGTTYRAMVCEYNGAAGDEKYLTDTPTDNPSSFATDTTPTLTTAAVADIKPTTAFCGGNVTSAGGDAVTARGVCWNTTGTPTVADTKTTDGAGTGEFSSSLTGLTPSTTYYVRAYATNSVGTAYGQSKTLTTDAADDSNEPGSDEPNEPGTAAPDLRVTIVASNQSAAVGEELGFEVDVANVGTANATDVTLRFPLPTGTEFIGAWLVGDQSAQSVPLEAYVENDEIVVMLGAVSAAQDVKLDVVLQATSSGAITLKGSVACSEQPTPAPAQVASDVEVDDVYYEIVQTFAPINACGVLGITSPLLLAFGLLAMQRRTRRR